MSWTSYLADRKVQHHKTSRKELEELRAVVERDLADAALPELSADRKFATAYNAALQLSKMAVACAGYRVTSGTGHHQHTFEVVRLALGRDSSPLADYFDTCRRKRNAIDYDLAHVASETEAEELLEKAREFQQLVEKWIKKHHPDLAL